MYTHFENVLETDPLRIKRYHTPHYKKLYCACVLIPTFLAFALVFFLVAYMSPRGMSMRQYQRDIYEWNADKTSQKMTNIQFSFKIMPYMNKNHSSTSMINMYHQTTPLNTEEEKQLNKLLSYQQSYYYYSDTYQIWPAFRMNNDTVPLNSSEDYCIHLWWRNTFRDKIYIDEDQYQNVSEQGQCLNSQEQTSFKWGQNDPSTGLSFKAWKETIEDLWCNNLTCALDCKLHQGFYKDGKCYKYEVIRRLCIKVDFSENDKGRVNHIEYAGGCFTDNEIEYFEPADPDKVYEFDAIPIEVRSSNDPYTVFTVSHYNLGRDLTLFLWLSIAMLVITGLLIIGLIIAICIVARISKIQGGPYVQDLKSYS